MNNIEKKYIFSIFSSRLEALRSAKRDLEQFLEKNLEIMSEILKDDVTAIDAEIEGRNGRNNNTNNNK